MPPTAPTTTVGTYRWRGTLARLDAVTTRGPRSLVDGSLRWRLPARGASLILPAGQRIAVNLGTVDRISQDRHHLYAAGEIYDRDIARQMADGQLQPVVELVCHRSVRVAGDGPTWVYTHGESVGGTVAAVVLADAAPWDGLGFEVTGLG